MTDLRKAAQQALEALEEYQAKGAPFWSCDAAVAALRDALEQPVQEPVAYFDPQEKGFYWARPMKFDAPVSVAVEPIPLYAAPPQREPLCVCGDLTALNTIHRADAPCYIPVGVYKRREPLTDEQIDALIAPWWNSSAVAEMLASSHPINRAAGASVIRHIARVIERAHGIGGGGEAIGSAAMVRVIDRAHDLCAAAIRARGDA